MGKNEGNALPKNNHIKIYKIISNQIVYAFAEKCETTKRRNKKMCMNQKLKCSPVK